MVGKIRPTINVFFIMFYFQAEGNGKRKTRFNTFRVLSVRNNLNASNILTVVLLSLV